MSTDHLTQKLQNLTIQEATLHKQLERLHNEIEQVRNKIRDSPTAYRTNATSAKVTKTKIEDRVKILNPTKITTVQNQNWLDRERTATITKITDISEKSATITERYNLLTDNGNTTWRKAKNVQRIER